MWLAMTVSLAGALVTMSGVLAARRRDRWARANKALFVSFAAGVLITVSLLHLVPESFALSPRAAPWLFGGYALMHLLDRLITTKVCSRPEEARQALGLVPLIGIGFHSFLDGIAYSVGFSVGPTTGLLMAFGMVLHEFPEGVVMYTLLLLGGYPPRRAVTLTVAAAALSTPAGTLLSWPFVDRLEPAILGILLSASAGALLYVGATHLLPQAAVQRSLRSLLALLAGAAVAAALTIAAG